LHDSVDSEATTADEALVIRGVVVSL